jgi:Tol biopolymer transport system component
MRKILNMHHNLSLFNTKRFDRRSEKTSNAGQTGGDRIRIDQPDRGPTDGDQMRIDQPDSRRIGINQPDRGPTGGGKHRSLHVFPVNYVGSGACHRPSCHRPSCLHPSRLLAILALLALILQGCTTSTASDPFQDKGSNTGQGGGNIKINTSQAAKFQGKIYFTLDRNLYLLDGNGNLKQLTQGMDVRDPAVSPDGKRIAFIRREKNYADLIYRSTNPAETTLHTIVSGNGQYYPNAGGANNFYWFAQPAWSADGTRIMFLSDLQKSYWKGKLPNTLYNNADFLDLQAFSLPVGTSTLTGEQALEQAQVMAYAYFGDGGLRDPSYRPNHPEQIIYTNYMYDPDTATKQVVQVELEDTTFLSGTRRWNYHPGYEPSVSLTPKQADLVNFQPSFSPDGNLLAYVRREGTTQMSLYVMPVAEGVANDPNDPQFDPNAEAVQTKALEPYNVSSKLLTQEFLSQPVWSPDGKHLLYYSYADRSFDVWIATVVKDAKTGRFSLQADSQVQLTLTGGHLNGDSRASWVK